MNVKHIRKRYNTYYYQRRVPKALIPVMQCKAYLKTLNTSDLSVAIKRAADINARWDALLESSNVGTLYDEIHARTVTFPEHLEDLFAFGDEEDQKLEFDKLSETDQAMWRAAQEKLTGKARDPKYRFSLVDGLREIEKVKRSTLPKKTWSLYEKAVREFGNFPLEDIKRPQVALWLDSLIDTTSSSVRKTALSCLGMIYDHAQTRGHITDNQTNPFRNHKHGPSDATPYELIEDDVLLKVMDHLSEDDRLIALVGRYHGMRLAEIFTSSIEEVEGIPCFNVKDAKTKAGIRMVPIKECIRDQVRASKDGWTNPAAYSKRFGRAKTRVVGKRRSIAFHSLRVAFITYAGRAGFPEQQVAWLVGHEEGKGTTMSGQLYFRGYSIQKMQEIVETVPNIKTPNHG